MNWQICVELSSRLISHTTDDDDDDVVVVGTHQKAIFKSKNKFDCRW